MAQQWKVAPAAGSRRFVAGCSLLLPPTAAARPQSCLLLPRRRCCCAASRSTLTPTPSSGCPRGPGRCCRRTSGTSGSSPASGESGGKEGLAAAWLAGVLAAGGLPPITAQPFPSRPAAPSARSAAAPPETGSTCCSRWMGGHSTRGAAPACRPRVRLGLCVWGRRAAACLHSSFLAG